MGLLLNQPVGCLCLFGGQKCGITHLYGAFLRQVHMGGKPHCPNRTDDSSAPSKKDLAHCCREARINDTTVPDSKKFLTMDLGFAHHAHLKNMKGQGCILPSWRLQTSRLRAENPSKTSSPFITDIQSSLCTAHTNIASSKWPILSGLPQRAHVQCDIYIFCHLHAWTAWALDLCNSDPERFSKLQEHQEDLPGSTK